MRLGFGFGVTMPVLPKVAAVAAPISSINADGWSAEWANLGTLPPYSTGDTEFQPNTNPITVSMTRKGYDETGALRSDVADTVTITRRVRQPWTNGTNNHLSGALARVALSGYVLANDIVAGVTNNSTETSPKPVAQHRDRNRRVIGDTGYAQVTAYHWAARNGKPVAAVLAWFRSTDGTKQTTPVLMSGPKVLPGGSDRFAVIGYDANIPSAQWSDGTSIPDGTTLIRECEVRPWVGDASSVRTTVGSTVDGRGFTPQTFYKHTARATNPVYVFVNQSSGVDETVNAAGVGTTSGTQKVSTSATTAKANPFATIALAIQALKAATTLTGGFTDGCIVQLAPGTFTSPSTTTAQTYQTAGEIIIETDPAAGDTWASITGTFASFRQSYLTYRRITLTRSSASQLAALAGGRIAVVNIAVDSGTQTSTFWGTVPIYIDGLTMSGAVAALGSGVAAHLMRGVKAGVSKGATLQIDPYNMCGCELFNAQMNMVSRPSSGAIHDSFSNTGLTTTFGPGYLAGETVDGYAMVNYVIEYANTASPAPILRPSGDGETSNVRHFIDWYRSGGGASLYGRDNSAYDETTGTLRTHTFWSRIGRSVVAYYTKHDWFVGATAVAGTVGDAQRAEAPSHVGAWSCMYEVNSRGNLHQFPTDTGFGPNFGPNGDRNPAFYGLRAKYPVSPASQYVRVDPKYVGGTAKATEFNGTATSGGAGGVAADYVPAADSPLIGMLTTADEALPFDITGAPRNRGTAGAFR